MNAAYCNATNCSTSSHNETSIYTYSFGVTIAVVVVALTMSVVTVFNNMLVLLSFKLEESLRTPNNYFLVSLAVSDIMVGLILVPWNITYFIYVKWPFGYVWCDLYNTLDFAICNASQFGVFAITTDRFCSIWIPNKYRLWRTHNKALIMIALQWAIPFSIFFPLIFIYQQVYSTRVRTPGLCDMEFLSEPLTGFVVSIFYFWVPTFFMFIMYAYMYNKANKLYTRIRKKQLDGNRPHRLSGPGEVSLTESEEMEFRDTYQEFIKSPNYSIGEHDMNINAKKADNVEKKNAPVVWTASCKDIAEIKNMALDINAAGLSSLDIPVSSTFMVSSNEDISPTLETGSSHHNKTFFSDLSIRRNHASGDNTGDLCGSNRKDISNNAWGRVFGISASKGNISRCYTARFSTPVDHQAISPIGVEKDHSVYDKSETFAIPSDVRKAESSTGYQNSTVVADGCFNSTIRKGLMGKAFGERRSVNIKSLSTVTIILGTYSLCWVPYHVLIAVYAVWPIHFPIYVWHITYYLCYLYSPISPFIYAYANPVFKRAYTRFLHRDFRKNVEATRHQV